MKPLQHSLFIESGAIFSPCRTWRYTLLRSWSASLPRILFIGLNPSTADEVTDDPTVRRCLAYTHRWGYGGVIVTNLFAFRAMDPRVMKQANDPVGPENDKWLVRSAEGSARVVVAWGNHGTYMNRSDHVLDLLRGLRGVELWCLGITGQGQPKHPLYLRGDTTPTEYKNPKGG